MQIVDAAFREIGQLFLHALQGSTEVGRVHHHTQQFVGAIPIRLSQTLFIDGPQGILSGIPLCLQHLNKVIKCFHIIMVKLTIEPLQFIVAMIQTRSKNGFLHGNCLPFSFGKRVGYSDPFHDSCVPP